MRNFRFSLERILGWRSAELQAEEAALAPLFADRTRLEVAREQVRAARERAASDLVAAGAVDGRDLEALAGYRLRLERDLIAIEHRLAQRRQEIAAQRARVLEAQRRVRLLEKLRARRLAEWQTAWQRESENFAAETFLARWKRNEGGLSARQGQTNPGTPFRRSFGKWESTNASGRTDRR
jgi:flagellar export protein FliJ